MAPVATENRIRAGADAAMGYPLFGMIDLLKLLGGLLVGVFRSHAAREAEMAFLRQQLVVLKRSAPARLRLRTAESGVSHQSLGSAVSHGGAPVRAGNMAIEHREKALGIGRIAGFDDDIEDQSAFAGR